MLLFPTAGGDAEEIERFHMIDVARSRCSTAGAIKVYSCDSVAGQALARPRGLRRATRCGSRTSSTSTSATRSCRRSARTARRADIEIWTAGASIGAFHAVAVVCRFPDVFTRALCMSGTYDLRALLRRHARVHRRLLRRRRRCTSCRRSTGAHLDALRTRFILLASGEGRAEDIGESWRMAHVLGSKGIPNRVDSWGAEWHHDWPTWREMLPKYLDEWHARLDE